LALVLAALVTVPTGWSVASARQGAGTSSLTISDQGVTLNFPDNLTFRASVRGDSKIKRVVLEYGVEKLTCGTVVAKAFPIFTPQTSVGVTWTWEMRKSGSEPPGAEIWYRWRATDEAGNEAASEKKTVVWLDDEHDWQSISRDNITLHWYEGSRTFAEQLLEAAVTSTVKLRQTTGVSAQRPVDLYIYGSNEDMQEAVLYEPNWTGGQAFPDSNIVIIGISPDQLEWGKRTVAHELTHVLTGPLAFSCLSSAPTWLIEGIAVYGEGGLDAEGRARLQKAIQEDELVSVRALSGGFSEHPDKANLSYSQSYSLVNYLLEAHGKDKLLDLFEQLRQGEKLEDALNAVYGFSLDELEDKWRASVGATPRKAPGASPTPTPLPTPVPTYPPIQGVPVAAQVEVNTSPEPAGQPSGDGLPGNMEPSAPTPGSGGGGWGTLALYLMAGVAVGLVIIMLLVGVVAYLLIRRRGT
jgi:hypothetical protein